MKGQPVKSLSVMDTKQGPILIHRRKNYNHRNNNNGYDSNGISKNNYLFILFINFAIQHQSK